MKNVFGRGEWGWAHSDTIFSYTHYIDIHMNECFKYRILADATIFDINNKCLQIKNNTFFFVSFIVI